MIRLLLVDDHPVVLGGLASALAAHPDVQIVAKAGSLSEARAALAEHDVDVALVDIRLPDGTGFELQPAPGSRTAFIMLTTFHTSQYLGAAMRLGAKGYLLKTSPIEDIVLAIRRVAAGGVAFLADMRASGSLGPELNPQEQQIVDAVAAGKTNKEISAQIGISVRTVEWHLAKLFDRTGVRSRSELAARAAREGWIAEDDGFRPREHSGG